MVKSASPTSIGGGAVHLDGARRASQRRLRNATFRPAGMARAARNLPTLMKSIAQAVICVDFFKSRPTQLQQCLWIELGIICAAIVRQQKTYSQKFSWALNFLIASVI